MNDPTDITYSYKPKLMGPSYDFQLTKDSLAWQIGPRAGRVAYPMIKRIRLGYKPTNMATARFIGEIWPLNAPKIQLASTSMRSLLDMADHKNEYRDFVVELHRRVARARAECSFEAGFPAWRWWPAAIAGGVTATALAYIVSRGIIAEQYLVSAGVAFVGLWFIWQMWNIVMRNRPRRYFPDQIPGDVLPGA